MYLPAEKTTTHLRCGEQRSNRGGCLRSRYKWDVIWHLACVLLYEYDGDTTRASDYEIILVQWEVEK